MHNNETHLLMCTVPWSHMTMKLMTVFFAWMLQACVSHVEVHEQVKTVNDPMQTNQNQI